MGIYYIPGVNTPSYVRTGSLIVDGSGYFTGKLQAATSMQVDASTYLTGKVQAAAGFQCDASALIGSASGNPVGFGGDAAIASAFQIDVTASDAAVITALSSIVDSLQAHGIMGASA